jgi:putative FmdB family regulatory protein
MPIYEYRCDDCHRRVSMLVRSSSESSVTCPNCGSTGLNRLVSTFAVRMSDQAVYEDILSDSRLVRGLESNDPRALAEWNKRISRGEETAPEHEEMLGRLEAGEMPHRPMSGEENSGEL